MPVLSEGRTIRSREPTLRVENRFEPGAYRFRLVVIDDERNASAPAELLVRVVEALRPFPPVVPVPVRPGPVLPGGRLRPDAPTTPAVPLAPVVAPRTVSRADSTDPKNPRSPRRRRPRPER